MPNMNTKRRAGPVVRAGLLAALGCTTPVAAPDTAGPDAALADTLATLIAAAYDFDRTDVVERMAALYPAADGSEGTAVVSGSGGRLLVSVDSVRRGIDSFWQDAGQNMRDARWVWREVHVQRLSEHSAVLTGTWAIPHIAPAGHEHVLEGAWTAVLRRIAGEWKIVHEHLSSPD
jgi:hypothetical protein